VHPDLSGFWRVDAIDMIHGPVVRLIGGVPGELIEFTADDRMVIWRGGRATPPARVRHAPDAESPGLDIWTDGLESFVARCVYRVEGDLLRICVAGNSGVRPAAIMRDDERLWCVMTLSRSRAPRRRVVPRTFSGEGATLVPGGFLDDSAEGLEFAFKGSPAGILEGSAPSAPGRYRYTPLRSPGHLSMQQEIATHGSARCDLMVPGAHTTFVVTAVPEKGVLEIAEASGR
jgi:hypothetical protein